MGLLDEAIREHLDLKRRRGADPAELERAEREALGPVRRKGEVAAIDYDDQDELFDDEGSQELESTGPAYDQADDGDWDYSEEPHAADAPLVDDEPESDSYSRGRRSRSVADADDEQEAPRGLAARFGLRRSRSGGDAGHDVGAADRDEPRDEDEPTPYAPSSDDDAAAADIGALAEDLGFSPIKLGGLSQGGLLVQARGNSWGQLIFKDLVKFDQ